MAHHSLSKKLLTQVLFVYFILTFIVTCGQIFAEYKNTKKEIHEELQALQNTFSDSFTRAIWELNIDQSSTIAKGLISIPFVEGVVVRDDRATVISQLGTSPQFSTLESEQLVEEQTRVQSESSGLFGYTSPLVFTLAERSNQVGDVTIFSSRAKVISRVMTSVYIIVGNAFIKTAFLIFLFLWAFRKQLTEPLAELTEQVEELDLDNLEGSRITLKQGQDSAELRTTADSFNTLINKLRDYKEELEQTQRQLVQSNEQLDQQNILLEKDVARKTKSLSQAMMDLQQQKYELEKQKLNLTEEIDLRRTTEQTLLSKQAELRRYIEELNLAQERLINSEKMAALGGLVAGITHDINTPIGISISSAGFLSQCIEQIEQSLIADESADTQALKNHLDESKQSLELLTLNLAHAAESIDCFKKIAVDQASHAVREIKLNEYLHEILRSLNPKLKHTKHKVYIDCPKDLKLTIPAGALSQIIANLLMNSLLHAFDEQEKGVVNIKVFEQQDDVVLTFEDNGKGLDCEQLAQLFEPFLSTRKNEGGTGLGTHIVFNLVKQTLGGDIQASSTPGQGLSYRITIAKNYEDASAFLS